jgi:chloride channel protein, CIC family
VTAPARWHEVRRDELRHLAARSRQVVLLAAAVGAATGLLVAGFDDAVVRLREEVSTWSPWAIALVPTVGLVLAGVALAVGRTGPGTSDEYIKAFHDGHALRVRAACGRLVAAVATLGSGAPMGLEGPSLYFGATVGDAVRRRLPRWTAGTDARTLVVAGAAAGVAAIFKAPATGAVFALEVPYQDDLARRMLLPALVASGSGYLVFVAFDGTAPILPVEGSPGFAARDLAAAACIGILAGLGARLFARLVRVAKRCTVAFRPWIRIVVAGSLLAGTFALGRALTGESIVLGSGYAVINWSMTTEEAGVVIAALLVLRCVATAATVGGGGVGGVFIPLVVAGALLGRIVGDVVDPEQMSLFVVVGAAAFLGAGYRVPLAAVMFVAETTGRPGFVVPGLIAAVAAELVMARSSIAPHQVGPDRIASSHADEAAEVPPAGPAQSELAPPRPRAARTADDLIDEASSGT